VIGAGMGGAFFADSLRSLANQSRIDVYESSARVGGRALDTTWFGEPADLSVDIGAAMFIEQNQYMASAAAALGLATECRATTTSGRARLLLLGRDGTPAFTESRYSLQTAYRLGRRFGLLGLKRLTRRGHDFITNFSRLYDVQAQGEAFGSVRDLLGAAGMASWPESSCSDALAALLGTAASREGATPGTIPVGREGTTAETIPVGAEVLVSALVRNNYGQAWAPMVSGAPPS